LARFLGIIKSRIVLYKRMTKHSTYRVTAATIAAVFLLFNIGLPIVVASCPITESKTRACGMCNDETDATAQKITSVKNTSCCITLFAADKNTTEFVNPVSGVKVKSVVNESAQLYLPILVSQISHQGVSLSPGIESLSPPRCTDIPILVSSLLI
jgi:hypothetical protein